MDTRKLEAHIDHDHGGRIESEGWGITATVDHAEDPEMIRELVRRWNAYPELIDLVERIFGHIQSAIDEDDDVYLMDLKTCDECGPDAIRALLNTPKA